MRAIVIFAAGMGTRMKSFMPKVLHTLCYKSMLDNVLDTAQILNPSQIILLVSENLLSFIKENPQSLHNDLSTVTLAVQKDPLGTGHAMQVAHQYLNENITEVLVLYGDVPLVQEKTLQPLLETDHDLTMLGMRITPPHSYGRLVTQGNKILKIVESKDATEEEKKIDLCWTGILKAKRDFLDQYLPLLTKSPVTGEYYLTQLVELASKDDRYVHALEAVDPQEFEGVNDKVDLARLEKRKQDQIRHAMMVKGVKLMDPDTVYFAHDTVVGEDTTIHPFVTFGPNVTVGEKVSILSFSHISDSTLHHHSSVGPCAHLHHGVVLGEKAVIGNFVEVKKSTLGKGSKAKHLSYIGDATLGEKVNMGAGSITANYDGKVKSPTIIHDHVMVGCNTTLIAPVTIHEKTMIAAGSVITKDVPEQTLAIARASQIHKNRKG